MLYNNTKNNNEQLKKYMYMYVYIVTAN